MLDGILAAAALLTGSAALGESDSILESAVSECGLQAGEAVVTDARDLRGAAAILAKANPQRGQINVLIGGDLSGEDMTAFERFGYHGCFYETDLSNTKWHQPTLVSTRFIRAKLSGADLRSARLDTAQFIGVDASGADFSGAMLGGAQWQGGYWSSKLEGARFREADMTSFRFSCGITMDESCGGGGGVDFAGATLTQADFSQYPIWGYDIFDGAKVDRTVFSARAVPYLKGLDLNGSIVIGSTWQDADRAAPAIALTKQEFGELQQASAEARKDVPSFDCAKAASSVETLLCGEYETGLRRTDRDMAKLYAQALAAGKMTRTDQRNWLRQRNRCENRDCLSESYARRMDALFAALGAELVLAPDAQLSFQDDVLPVSEEYRSSGVYRRLAPAMRWASMQEVTLSGREDGKIDARGEAVGGNAHTCSLYGDELVYDPRTGWYSGEVSDGELVPILRVWDKRLFFRYSGNMGDTPDKAENFISCGARAGFSEMRQAGL